MKKTVLTFGLISGILCSLMMVTTLPLADRIGFDRSMIVGYTTMVAAFLLVFFGIRSYRDNLANGSITFGRAFTVGILITLITCAFYVVTWEILYFNFLPDFMDQYSAHLIQKAQSSGMSSVELQAKVAEIQRSKALYHNPLYNSAITLLEPLPVGFIMTVLSAAILRRKPQSLSGQSSAVTS